jgi:glycosyltransferase involved in cell wall biosynthesis
MKLRIEKSVVVITPTIGSPKLADAITSVENQTYGNLTHLVVIDGPQYFKQALQYMPVGTDDNSKLQIMTLPWNTGANGFNGQRIYASVPHLIDADYIFFLDQDNWYKPDHVESLVDTIESKNLDFAFSLREVFTEDKSESILDNCESLGLWPIYFTLNTPQREYLVDTSAFAFTKRHIQGTCHLYHSGAWGEDRRYLAAMPGWIKWDTSGKYTLNYRVGGNKGSVNMNLFKEGNKVTEAFYKGNYPWLKT